MSSNGFSSAAAAASPAPAASTPPVPGSSPSQPASAGPSGPGGAAPAPPQARAETQPTVEDDTASTSPNCNAKENGQQEEEQGTTTDAPKPLPALPSPESASGEGGDGVRTVHVNGQPIALDALGPMVVNRDGTISRIANWPEMTEIERENTLRILCKRNQLRLGNLRAGRPADAPQEGSS